MQRLLSRCIRLLEPIAACWPRRKIAHSRPDPRRLICEWLEPREVPSAAWLGDGWQYRSDLTVSAAQVADSETLARFPLLIDSTQPAWRHVTAGGRNYATNGADFAFTANDGRTRLDFEIEAYDPQTGHLTAWVLLPLLTTGQDSSIYAYYGHEQVADPGAGDAVWADYESVHHFEETPDDAVARCGARACDASGNAHGLDGSPMVADDSTPGRIGNALSFERPTTGLGADAYSFNVDTVTLSGWIRADQVSPRGYVVSLPRSSSANGFDIQFQGGMLVANLVTDDGYQFATYPVSYTDGLYHYVAASYDGTQIRLYYDGDLVATQPHSGRPRLTAQRLTVGLFSPDLPDYKFFGSIDEVRVSASRRSANWIKNEYANQSLPDSFYIVGAEERRPLALGWLDADWQYRTRLSVSGTGVSGVGTLRGFPLLVDSTEPNWRQVTEGGRNFDSNGGDFTFTAGDGRTRLDFEIEFYDPQTGRLTAWVLLPQLSAEEETGIYVYYGKASAGAPTSAPLLWSDYASVYHFQRTPGEAVLACGDEACDASENGRHLDGPLLNDNDSVTGKTGNAVSLEQPFSGLRRRNYTLDSSAITLSAWIRADRLSPGGYVVALPRSSTANGFDLQLLQGTLVVNLVTEDGYRSASYPVNYADDVYHYIVASYGGGNVRLYCDGNLVASTPHSGRPRLDAREFNVGYFSDALSSYKFFGDVDEVRVATSARSADWIKTEFANQSSPDSFYQIGAEEQPWDSSAWPARVTLTVDNTAQGETLYNYQMRVAVAYRQGMRDDFADVRFANSDATSLFDYWLEDRVLGSSAQFWVELPVLPGAQSTPIYLYYGNPAASSISNGAATFAAFDDFNDSVIDRDLWSISGHPDEYNGTLVLKDDTEFAGSTAVVSSGYAVRHRSWQDGRGGTFVGFQDPGGTGRGSAGWAANAANEGGAVQAFTRDQTGVIQTQFSQAYSDQWHIWETQWTASEVTHSILGEQANAAQGQYVPQSPMSAAASTAGAKLLMDWLLVRRFISVEPVITTGAGEPNPQADPPAEPAWGEWEQVVADDPASEQRWSPRDSAGELVYDGAMWILGGWHDSQERSNDVWKSLDGVNWQLVTAAAPWNKRNLAGVTVHGGKMWIAGGIGTDSYSDVWYSTDGANWTLATENAPWGPRGALTLVSFQNKLYVIGGMDFRANNITFQHYNDVWSSPDGVAWTREANDVFPQRSMHSSVVFDDKIWVFGGGIYDRTYGWNTFVNYHDVWYTADGVTWTAATLAAPWTERRFAEAVLHRGYIWIIGGHSRGNMSDVWVSRNGRDWEEIQEPLVFSERHAPSALSFQGSLWVLGGLDDRAARNDIWRHP